MRFAPGKARVSGFQISCESRRLIEKIFAWRHDRERHSCEVICQPRDDTIDCKNWNQVMIECPELRDQGDKGSAMGDFFPPLADCGANHDEPKFDRLVNVKTGATGDDRYRRHAVFMLKQVTNIKKFHNVCTKLLTLLG